MKIIKLLFCSGLALSLLGCQTTNTLYDWGGYDESLYEYYHDPIEAKEFPVALETHLAQLEQNEQKPAPGLYAEVGTFKLKTGDIPSAINYYEKEATAWPESAVLMNAIVENLRKQSKDIE
ncbi:DUF4810 domain-containing protein [Vibrio diabolicus]|uniref:DUF4810 domain-containing protein n=1 Tax=Vibrio diabolicus TaxID=50719 RepID=UPI0035A8EB46